jgi:hypothetical protein
VSKKIGFVKYKIVEDKRHGFFHVMYRRYWFSAWRYCRAPRTKLSTYRHIWTWETRKAAEIFIGLELKEANNG